MRHSILILAVACLGLFSSNAQAQAPDTSKAPQTDNKVRNDLDCPAFVPQTPLEDRLGNARRCYQQGLDLSESGQFTEAAGRFRQALQFDPEYADAYAALGRMYFKLREWQKATENLNRAAGLKRKQREANESALKREIIAETPAATVADDKSSAPLPAPPKETQSATTSTKNNAVQSSDTSELKLPKEAEIKTGTDPASPASENSDPPEQTTAGARVSMSVTPAPNVKETAGPAVSTIPPAEDLPLTKIYRVGANDVLDVRLNDLGQQSTLYTVTATGLLEHPLLNEPMPVTGLTVEEIGTRIEEDLRKRAIVENPKAVVGVRDYASHAVLVSGLAGNAGTKFLRREAIPLYVVVADAQPAPEAAKVTVVRNESNQIFEIDLTEAADLNFLVRSGDVITLSPNTTQFVYIGGEIKSPGEKTFRRGLTLMQVILSAGGVGPKAKIAEIARDDGKGFLVSTRFKLKDIASGKATDPMLQPGDRISILR